MRDAAPLRREVYAPPTLALTTVTSTIVLTPLAVHALCSAGLAPALPQGAIPTGVLLLSVVGAVLAMLGAILAAGFLGRPGTRPAVARLPLHPRHPDPAPPPAAPDDVLRAIVELGRESGRDAGWDAGRDRCASKAVRSERPPGAAAARAPRPAGP